MADELVVTLSGVHVGTLVRTRKGARFSYDAVMMKHEGRPLLSCSLPVKARAYSEGLTSVWFEGLLPEGERRSRLCREFSCHESDWFELLAHVGRECAGAVSICEPGFVPPAPVATSVLSEEELAELLRSLPSLPGNPGGARVSLGGYQEKAVVVLDGEGKPGAATVSLPDAAAVSTHILKPQPASRYPGIVEAEAWAMTVAAQAARCAKTWLLESTLAPRTLVVERFDRMRRSGCLERVHQEDCCQAMGLPPTSKYASVEGPRGSDPSYAKIAALLVRYAADPGAELRELVRQTTANVVLGNLDAHAKNHAFLYQTPCVPALAPMYDVVPVDQVEPPAHLLSMRINGKVEATGITRADLVAEAASWGLPESVVAETIEVALANLADGIERAGRQYPDAAERYAPRVLARIARLQE